MILFLPPDPVDSPLLNFFLNALGGQGGPAGQARAQRAEQDGGARYRKMPIFRTPPLISDKSGGFTAFLATGKVIDKYKILKLLN